MNEHLDEKDAFTENELIHRASFGDVAAQEMLIRRYQKLVNSLSYRFFVGSDGMLSREELVQAGYVGLMEAIRRFDPQKHAALSTYALWWIMGEMRRAIRNAANRFGGYELIARIKRWQSEYEKQNGKIPGMSELSQGCNLPMWQIASLLNTEEVIRYEDEAVGSAGCKENGILDPGLDHHLEVTLAIEALNREERQVILLRYYRDQTQKETAATIGKSQTQVSRIEQRAISQLRIMLS